MALIKFFSLGGLDEHGKDTYIFETKDSILIFDNGLAFPENEIFGIKKIIADISYLFANKHKIKGLFLTQDSELLNGGVSYLIEVLPEITIYTSAYNQFIIEQRIAKRNLKNAIKFVKLTKNQEIKIDDLQILAFPTFSNAFQSLGYAIKFESSIYVYVQDFLISNDNNTSFITDFSVLTKFIGQNCVQMLACGVNNAPAIGFTSPSHKVKGFLDKYLRDWNNRALIAIYQNDFYSVMSVVSLAKELQRPLIIFGRTLEERFNFLQNSGAINTANLVTLDASKISESKNAIIIIAGSVDRLFAKISKIATGYDEILSVLETDIFISLAPSINGNEMIEAKTLDDMARTDAKIVSKPFSINYPKASSEDIKNFINLLDPINVVPVGGFYKNFIEFSKVVLETGFKKDNIHLLNNGEAILFDNNKFKNIDRHFLTLKEVYVDSLGVSDIGAIVLSEREQMANDGVALFAIGIDKTTKLPVTTLDIQMRGVVFIGEDNKAALEKINNGIYDLVTEFAKLYPANKFDLKELKHEIRKKGSKLIEKHLKKRPIVLPSVVEIG